MKKFAYAVFDSKAKFFTSPFFCANDMVAKRMFASAARDPATDISKFPLDYTLFRVGQYDDEKAALITESPIENLGMAAQYLQQQGEE